MNYILIIYLIGVFINCCFAINALKHKYNKVKVITIGKFLEDILLCFLPWILLSWLFILILLVAWLCLHIESIVNKPLFKKHK